MNVHYRNKKAEGLRGQAIVEFAIVFPVLMMLLVGIFEAGRMLFIYSAVTNASREAARFGSALGFDDAGNHKYKDCVGIRERAQKSAYFLNLTAADITIQYDQGPAYSATPYTYCDQTTSGEDSGVYLHTSGEPDRIKVIITASYSPLIRLIPFPSRTFTSESARTILGYVEVGSSSSSGSGSGSGSGSATATSGPTATGTLPPSNTPTVTSTATKTSTPAPIATFTPLPSSTPTLVPTSTNTATATATATSTATATGTATPIASCTITTSTINMASNSNVVSMTITNPYTDVTVSSIQFKWNAASGANGNKTLTLQGASLGTTLWSVNDATGNITLTPVSTLTIPGNNRTTTITFTFDKSYQNPITNQTIITINLSTPGCNAITKAK